MKSCWKGKDGARNVEDAWGRPIRDLVTLNRKPAATCIYPDLELQQFFEKAWKILWLSCRKGILKLGCVQ